MLQLSADKYARERRLDKAVLSFHQNMRDYIRDVLDGGGRDWDEFNLKVGGMTEELLLLVSRVRSEHE